MTTSGDSLMQNDLFQQVDGGAIPTSPLQLFFRKISSQTANEMILKNHYAHRKVPISWCFGAFFNDVLEGVITFGKPVSYTLCEGSVGKENSKYVYELNRLWMSEKCPRNSESRFIAWALRELRRENPNLILVSFADTEQNHRGGIYKATGWIYTGLSAKRTDAIQEIGNKHASRHTCKAGLPQKQRSRKHRFF